MKWCHIPIVIFFYKFIFNLNAYIKSKYYFEKYKQWLIKPNESLLTHEESIKKLFNLAGIKDSSRPYIEQITNMHIYESRISVMNNMFVRRADVQHTIIGMFQACIGIFRSRILESFSLFYWVDIFLFFPKNILNYLNLDPEKAAYRILNVVLTAIWWTFVTSLTIFKKQFKAMIINFIEILP